MAITKTVMKGPNEIVPFDHHAIHYPQLCSIKFDGFRMLNLCGEQLLSPAMKPVRNYNIRGYLQELLDFCQLHRLVTDGEMWSPKRKFHEQVTKEGISSILTTHEGHIPDDIIYCIFDVMREDEWDAGIEKPFVVRWTNYLEYFRHFSKRVMLVDQFYVNSPDAAQTAFDKSLSDGEEGIILRNPNAGYKHGRCTLNQDGMWKFKEFQTVDGVIWGVEEEMRLKPGVPREYDTLGHLKREYASDLYEPAGMLGSFIVTDGNGGPKFRVKPGKGMDHQSKKQIWENYCRNQYSVVGKHIEYKFMPHGTLDRPRIGSMVGWRPDKD